MPKPKENISKQLNIILFNYVQPTERNNPGGGVTIYLRNLSSALRSKGHRVITLSAGDRYNPFWPTPYLDRPTEDELIIVNSPVVAPAAFSFHHPDIYLSNQSINKIPNRIKKEISTVNVFHFHNIEGLTYEFFASLRKEFPKSAMLFSAHNYNIVCPQVNLWKNDNISCSDFDDGIACLTCTPKNLSRSRKIIINALKTPIKYLDKSKGPLSKILYQTENLLQKNPHCWKSITTQTPPHPNQPQTPQHPIRNPSNT